MAAACQRPAAAADAAPAAADAPAIRHLTVYFREGEFAAWPANHGIWSWGDEILVGFQAARHRPSGTHTWAPKTSPYRYIAATIFEPTKF